MSFSPCPAPRETKEAVPIEAPRTLRDSKTYPNPFTKSSHNFPSPSTSKLRIGWSTKLFWMRAATISWRMNIMSKEECMMRWTCWLLQVCWGRKERRWFAMIQGIDLMISSSAILTNYGRRKSWSNNFNWRWSSSLRNSRSCNVCKTRRIW